jgi:hypothetical protein
VSSLAAGRCRRCGLLSIFHRCRRPVSEGRRVTSLRQRDLNPITPIQVSQVFVSAFIPCRATDKGWSRLIADVPIIDSITFSNQRHSL